MIEDQNITPTVQRWMHELKIAERRDEKWRNEASNIEKRYRNDHADLPAKSKTFNILWANTETLRPALYSNTAKPDVRRRFGAGDAAARGGSMIIERAIEAMLDNSEFDVAMENAVQDMLLTGRGVARIHYRPTMEMQEVRMGLVEVNSDTEPFTRFADESGEERLPSFDNDGAFFMSEEETVSSEKGEVEFIPWDRKRFGPARQW